MTYTEIDSCEGEAGDFTVILKKKPRYIREDKCTGCTTCVEYCPVKIPDPFNQEISKNKAVHIYFSQAIPLITYIDQNCLYLKEKKCRICEAVCKHNAIDFSIKPEKVEIKVGAIILSLGFDPYDPRLRDEYKYGKFQNIVTSMDYERILSSTGPYEGEIRRSSDLKHPQKIAWIQCVGSRQLLSGANSYCSTVCCTYTQKQVILTKEHDPGVECVVFHNDIRAYGKDFERFFQRAESLPKVRFIRSYVNILKEDPVTKNITIRYSTHDEGVKDEEFELVVLSVGLCPPKNSVEIAKKFGIELNSHNFIKVDPFSPFETTKKGIFVSGAFSGPKDIPESVYGASAAASKCGEILKRRRGKLTVERVYPEEKDVSLEEPRVGVFVCYCGANIGRVVDVPSVVSYAYKLPYVVYAVDQLFSCSTESTKQIMEAIKEHNLNRVVVAACTPRTHEPTFRDSLREGGLNQYYFEFANIREHCSWVHSREKEEATAKSKELLRMSLARALRLEALEEFELPVDKRVLIIGGGIAGMTCALSIASQGFEVYLVEKEAHLGGIARRIYYTIEGLDVQAYLKDLIKKVLSEPLIHVFLNAKILHATGYVGNFLTKIESDRGVFEIKHGATVIATGAQELKPNEYLYGESPNVFTNLELEELIAKKDERVISASTVVMIQCVGSRTEERNYCSRICCSESIKNALKLKEINPACDIYILYRDMRTYGFYEDYYREASNKGVRFIRYEPENKPSVKVVKEGTKEFLKVTVFEPVLKSNLEIDADIVSLASAVIAPESNKEVSLLFNAQLGQDNFFKEAHVKLRPVDFAIDGVYLCGIAHYPKHISETISQAVGAAQRVITLISHDTVVASGSVCTVDEKRCMGCGACSEVCAYGAIEIYETKQGKKAKMNPVLCKGCGLCNSKCPTGAIQLKHYKDDQIFAQIDAANPEREIVEEIKEVAS